LTDLPVLDAPRLYANNSLGRVVGEDVGVIEPYLDETDSWVAKPLRVVHDQGHRLAPGGRAVSLNAADIERLREAIAA
jgi:hypothetical protein